MYLAGLINEVLESKKDKLVKRSSYYYIINVLNSAFRRNEPFKFRFETYDEFERDEYSVSGIYDMDTNTKYIILNLPKNSKTFTLGKKRWNDFKFSVSQVCQHEAIHQYQWLYRDESMYEVSDLDFRVPIGDKEEEKEYLSDLDEIDAYAHDIAMEIKYYYPRKDPYEVLSKLNKHKKIWSYRYYLKTFKNEKWDNIRNRLLKKTYNWIPHTVV